MSRKYDHVMVDLETLGTRPGCVVLSVGAVFFDPALQELGPELHIKINRRASLIAGLRADPATLEWWSRQSPEAQQLLEETADPGTSVTIEEALGSLSQWFAEHGPGPSDLKVWGNGSDFDQPILVAVYAALGVEQPWRFWNNRCYRTLKAQCPEVKIVRGGTYHSALDDARSQVEHLFAVASKLAWSLR